MWSAFRFSIVLHRYIFPSLISVFVFLFIPITSLTLHFSNSHPSYFPSVSSCPAFPLFYISHSLFFRFLIPSSYISSSFLYPPLLSIVPFLLCFLPVHDIKYFQVSRNYLLPISRQISRRLRLIGGELGEFGRDFTPALGACE